METLNLIGGGAEQNRWMAWPSKPCSLRGHLTFHLKHEVLHLERLSRLFEQLDQAELVDWIQQEPGGQYARKAGFLYEWQRLAALTWMCWTIASWLRPHPANPLRTVAGGCATTCLEPLRFAQSYAKRRIG